MPDQIDPIDEQIDRIHGKGAAAALDAAFADGSIFSDSSRLAQMPSGHVRGCAAMGCGPNCEAPPTDTETAAGERASHFVTIEFDGYGSFPDLTFACNAAPRTDPACHMICQRDECEEGCTKPGDHPETNIGYCLVTPWLNGSDDHGCHVIDDHTSVTVPFRYDWNGEGVDWAFLPATPLPAPVREPEEAAVEALAEALFHCYSPATREVAWELEGQPEFFRRAARALLTSDWLAEFTAKARAAALREAADNMPINRPGQPYEFAAHWLRECADRIDGGAR